MTVMPSMVIALWSDGPAPPRRLSWPAFGSASRTPQDCNSLISCAVGMALAVVGFIGRARVRSFLHEFLEGRGCLRRHNLHGMRRPVVEDEMEQFRAGVMADRIHHPL